MRPFLHDGVPSTFCDSFTFYEILAFHLFLPSSTHCQIFKGELIWAVTLPPWAPPSQDRHLWFCNFLSPLSPNSFDGWAVALIYGASDSHGGKALFFFGGGNLIIFHQLQDPTTLCFPASSSQSFPSYM